MSMGIFNRFRKNRFVTIETASQESSDGEKAPIPVTSNLDEEDSYPIEKRFLDQDSNMLNNDTLNSALEKLDCAIRDAKGIAVRMKEVSENAKERKGVLIESAGALHCGQCGKYFAEDGTASEWVEDLVESHYWSPVEFDDDNGKPITRHYLVKNCKCPYCGADVEAYRVFDRTTRNW